MIERASRLGAHVISEISEIAARRYFIVGARGKGLLLALEFAPHHRGMQAGDDFTNALIKAFRKEGLSTTSKGPVSVGFSPPLTISDIEITEVLERIERVAANPASL